MFEEMMGQKKSNGISWIQIYTMGIFIFGIDIIIYEKVRTCYTAWPHRIPGM